MFNECCATKHILILISKYLLSKCDILVEDNTGVLAWKRPVFSAQNACLGIHFNTRYSARHQLTLVFLATMYKGMARLSTREWLVLHQDSGTNWAWCSATLLNALPLRVWV